MRIIKIGFSFYFKRYCILNPEINPPQSNPITFVKNREFKFFFKFFFDIFHFNS